MKKIFGRLDTTDLIKQITIVALFMALGVTLQRPLDIHVGTFHIFSATIIASFLMVSFTDWRVSLLGSMTMITLGELIVTQHDDFWTNYLPMFVAILLVHIFKLFKSFWISIIGIIIAIVQFELLKAFIVYLSYGLARGYAQTLGAFIQIGTSTLVVLMIYSSLYKVVKMMNTSIYSYNK